MANGRSIETDQRRNERYSLAVDITIREVGNQQFPARLCSLSASGCLVCRADRFEQGSRVWVRLPGLESQLAIVVSATGRGLALVFERPLHASVAASFAAAHLAKSQGDQSGDKGDRQPLDQRSEPRFKVPADAIDSVEVGGAPAALQNVSSSGVEVVTGTQLRLGSIVPLRFANGQVLAGRVVRRRGASVALRLPRFSIQLTEAA